MAENSNIEWTTHTFNPWIGCTKVSDACLNCYAEAWENRFGGTWGAKSPRRRTKTWGNPVKWNAAAGATGFRPRVFCASLADVFDNHSSILPAWRRDLWNLIRETPNLDWLLLTKRPQNIRRFLPDDWGSGWRHVWLGATVEHQEAATRCIPPLLEVPANVHFLSCEPLLGAINLRYVRRNAWAYDALMGVKAQYEADGSPIRTAQCAKLDWIITGGESGHKFRDVPLDYYRHMRNQCAATGTPFLFKQHSGKSKAEIKARGRLLDGTLHDAYPKPSLEWT